MIGVSRVARVAKVWKGVRPVWASVAGVAVMAIGPGAAFASSSTPSLCTTLNSCGTVANPISAAATSAFDILYGVSGTVAAIALAIAAYRLMTTHSNPQANAQARQGLLTVIGGVAVLAAINVIITFIAGKAAGL